MGLLLSFTSSTEPGGWDSAGQWATSCTSSLGRSEFFPKITWSSREPGGMETKQSHDTGACAILQQRNSRTQQFSGWLEIWLMRCEMTTRDKVNTSCKHSDLKLIFRVWQCVWHPNTGKCVSRHPSDHNVHVWSREEESRSTPHPVFCRKSDSAGELLPIPFTQGLGGSLVQSTLLTVIFTNPTATLLCYRSRIAFAPTNRFRSGNNVAKKCARCTRSSLGLRSVFMREMRPDWAVRPHCRSPRPCGAATRPSLRVVSCRVLQGSRGVEGGRRCGWLRKRLNFQADSV